MSKAKTKSTTSKKPAAVKKPKAVKAAPAKAERESRNGIPRPGAKTICGSVWQFLDSNPKATAADVIAGIKDINEATARTQFQRHRKFSEVK